jgi:hypothetical protein
MWIIKAKGESYYVNHVICELPWSTKETPDNSATKGSIKIKNVHLVIDDDNTAHLRALTPEISNRLKNPEPIIRVITSHGEKLREATENLEHVGIKTVGGGCSTLWYITEFNSEEQFVLFKLTMVNHSAGFPVWRELKPNEDYYKIYEKFKGSLETHLDEDEFYDFDDQDLPEYEELYEN